MSSQSPNSINSLETQVVDGSLHPIDIFINQIFETKPQEKRNNWIQILKDNELESLDELNEMTEDMWNCLELPSVIKGFIKKALVDLKESGLKEHEKQRIDDFLEDYMALEDILKKMNIDEGNKKFSVAKEYILSKNPPSTPPPTNCKQLFAKTLSESLPLYQYVGKKEEMKKYYTFLVIGKTGSGKTTLLDAFVNYLTGVKYTDTWRWKLVDENLFKDKDGSQSQTTEIKTYYINDHKNEFNVRIIDTPGFGDTEGVSKDNQITKQFERLFKEEQKEIDYILVTSQSSETRLTPSTKYVYDCVQSLFGKDAAERFVLMCTFSDGNIPHVTKTLEKYLSFEKYFTFNNSALYAPSAVGTSQTKYFWKMAMESVESFIKYVVETNRLPLSLNMSQKVLEFREYLLVSIKSSTQFIQQSFEKLANVESILDTIQKDKDQINSNSNYKLPDLEQPKNIITELPKPLQYCNKCQQLCCQYCAWPPDSPISKCTYFSEGRNCPICPGRCPIGNHERMERLVKTEYVKVQNNDSSKKANFEKGKENLKKSEQLKLSYTNEAKNCLSQISRSMKEIQKSLKNLSEIAMRPSLFSDEDFFLQLVQNEKEEKKLGWEKRVKQLEEMIENSKKVKQIQNSQNVQDLFPERYKKLFASDLKDFQ